MDASDMTYEPDGVRFDLIHAANLIDRIPVLVKTCARLLEPNGIIVLFSPLTWSTKWALEHQ
jgi:hypothetical protein